MNQPKTSKNPKFDSPSNTAKATTSNADPF